MKFRYYKLKPEIPGKLGERTDIDNASHPPKIRNLHFEFDGWLGDDLIECFPCYLITENLLMALNSADLSGFIMKDAEISFSQIFNDLYPNKVMPSFKWLIISGEYGDDFFMGNNYLHVSSEALDFLKHNGRLRFCEIEEVTI